MATLKANVSRPAAHECVGIFMFCAPHRYLGILGHQAVADLALYGWKDGDHVHRHVPSEFPCKLITMSLKL